jgi:signal transduction histidine kinase
MKVISLGEVVAAFEKTIRRTIREDIELQTTLTSASDLIEADVSQIEQILLNLAANAQDAMPNGGTIRITTTRAKLDQALSGADPGAASGEYVGLELGDTGCGIETEALRRVFEPFFTTKEKGRGTGLGLATVHGIVKQHGGHVSVDSSPGKGTTC